MIDSFQPKRAPDDCAIHSILLSRGGLQLAALSRSSRLLDNQGTTYVYIYIYISRGWPPVVPRFLAYSMIKKGVFTCTKVHILKNMCSHASENIIS